MFSLGSLVSLIRVGKMLIVLISVEEWELVEVMFGVENRMGMCVVCL